jgi:ferredoxin
MIFHPLTLPMTQIPEEVMAKVPVLDLGRCTDCEGCMEVCPEVFRRNDMGYIEVIDLPAYAEACVQEAIKCCPADCISWEEVS